MRGVIIMKEKISEFFQKEEFQLYMLLKEVASETLISRNDVDISYECKKDMKIYADYNALKQVLRILVDNSIKFNKDIGRIILNGEEKENGIFITVADFGIGIPEESIPHIFDRFYRVDKSRTKTTGGTGLGLGLAIARQIVEYHNGIISAESKLGEGCNMSIFIP
jgi:signal transduction histidine kinase